MLQQVIVYILVAAAAVYLGRYIFDGVRSIIVARSCCGDGCSKCAFAEQPKKAGAKNIGASAGTIIPLTEIRPMPRRKPQ